MEWKTHGNQEALRTMADMEMNLKEEIINRQKEDVFLSEELRKIAEGRQTTFELGERDSLWFQGRICVPDISEIKEVILKEALATSSRIPTRL